MNRQTNVIAAVSRRSLMTGGVSALALGVLGMGGPRAFAQEESDGEITPEEKAAQREKMQKFDFVWRATSPATHLGDEYTLKLTNTGVVPQEIWVRAVIMDHRNHTNLLALDEIVMLEPGTSQDFAAANDYGTANHFNTTLATKTETGIELAVTVTAADGAQAATFNERAFMVDSRVDLAAEAEARREEMRGRRRRHEDDGHEHGEPEATPAT